jgi:hypothetical protein
LSQQLLVHSEILANRMHIKFGGYPVAMAHQDYPPALQPHPVPLNEQRP